MASWEQIVRIGRELPEVSVDDWYNSPALKVRKKGFARMWTDREHVRHGVDRAETPVLVVMCDADEKAALLDTHSSLFETPHYEGHGAMLVRLADVDGELLEEVIENAWRQKAPKTLITRFDER